MTREENQAQDTLVRVEEADGIVEFHGAVIGMVSTRAGDQPRWTELTLYQVTDGSAEYALHNSGRSVLYHIGGSPCNTGLPRVVSDIPDQEYDTLIPHARQVDGNDPCNPPGLDDLNVDDTINVEMNRNSVTKCASAADVVKTLQQERYIAGKRDRFLSAPAVRLLHLAAETDPAIRNEITKKRAL